MESGGFASVFVAAVAVVAVAMAVPLAVTEEAAVRLRRAPWSFRA